MRRSTLGILMLGILCLATNPAEAKGKRTSAYAPECNVTMPCVGIESPVRQTKATKRTTNRTTAVPRRAGLVTVSTAAGIDVTVSTDFAPKIQALISDLVASGIKPKQIHCYARGGHVRGSYHYSGNACDFDFYRGCMGCSARWTRHIGTMVAARGLRNGCSFGDCGHIDNGTAIAHRHHPHRTRYAHLR